MLGVVEGQVLVDLVRDHGDVVFFAQVGDQRHFFEREDAPGRVVRRVEDDRAGFGVKGFPQFVGVERPRRRMQRHVDRRRARHRDVGDVAVEVRLDDDHLVAFVDQAEHRREDRFGRARRDDDARVGINVEVIEAVGVGGNCLSQRGVPGPGAYWLYLPACSACTAAATMSAGRVEVRLALTEIERVVLLRQHVDFGEDGRAEVGDSVGHFRHLRIPLVRLAEF